MRGVRRLRADEGQGLELLTISHLPPSRTHTPMHNDVFCSVVTSHTLLRFGPSRRPPVHALFIISLVALTQPRQTNRGHALRNNSGCNWVARYICMPPMHTLSIVISVRAAHCELCGSVMCLYFTCFMTVFEPLPGLRGERMRWAFITVRRFSLVLEKQVRRLTPVTMEAFEIWIHAGTRNAQLPLVQ
jgi:hypothetical protein